MVKTTNITEQYQVDFWRPYLSINYIDLINLLEV